MSVACGRSTVKLGTATERAVIVLPRAVSCPGASWPIHLLEHHPRSKAGHMAELPITGTSQSQVTSHKFMLCTCLARACRPAPFSPTTSTPSWHLGKNFRTLSAQSGLEVQCGTFRHAWSHLWSEPFNHLSHCRCPSVGA